MVTLPKDFVSTRYSGYFWNVKEQKLYSLKVTGELRLMSFFKGGIWNGVTHDPGYRISVNGARRKYNMKYLTSLKPTTDIQEIVVAK